MEIDTDTEGDESFAVYGSDGEEIKFDFSSHIKDTEPSEEDAEAPCLQPHDLIPFFHSYLGELHCVRPHHAPVVFSHDNYRLPIIKDNCVLFPAQIVPVWVGLPFSAARMLAVANGESDLAGYVVMAWPPPLDHPFFTEGYRGCIAKVLQISENGQRALVQGVCICSFPDWETEAVFTGVHALSPLDEVLVLAWPETCPPPGEARSQLDFLANSAMAVFRRNYPLVGGIEGDPLQVAYWLASNTPLPTTYCAALLREPPLMLLTTVRELSARFEVLTCQNCGTEVADAKDLIQVVDQGPCLVCVNPGGYTHKIICLRKELRGAQLVGTPSSEFTWFPGYAWQGIVCGCEMHLGWVFTAFEANMPIKKFWGLTQGAIGHQYNHGPADSSDEADSPSASEEDAP